jgi:glycosyltransferase involved in cell wall biosynthesis
MHEAIPVLHVLDKLTVGESHLHGVTRLLSWWLPVHDRRRFRIAVVSLRGRDAAGAHLEGLGIPVHYLRRGPFDPRVPLDLARLARREGARLLHLHGYAACNFGRLAARWRGLPCIVHEHIVDAAIPAYQRLADRLLAPLASHALAISEPVREFMARGRALPLERIEVLHNGIPLAPFLAPGPPDRSWRAAAGVPEGEPLVAIVGRLHELKGHRYFLAAARRILEAGGKARFLLVGDGELRGELEELSRSLGIAERVHFLGHREDVPTLLRDAEVAVIASLSEGGPLVLFEAMAAGCATLVTETCGLAREVADGESGFVIPARDASAIADRVLRLLGDPDLRRRLAAAGRARVACHDVARSVRRLEELYLRLLARG